jgi:hypothetical protein
MTARERWPGPATLPELAEIRHVMFKVHQAIEQAEREAKSVMRPCDELTAALERLETAKHALVR